MSTYSLMIHGGAGPFAELKQKRDAEVYFKSMRIVMEQGRSILSAGGAALDTVVACCAMLEDDPLFNAGRGSVLNYEGHVEMDAAVMTGHDLAAGAVAAIRHITNPIKLARLILERNDLVMLAGDGAMQFALTQGVEVTPDDYFITPKRKQQWLLAKNSNTMHLDQDDRPDGDDQSGTVGVVARDVNGDLAAATSTGGLVNKPVGRIGDSPVIGAGVIADNASCAVSATGCGEDILRTVLAKTLADYIVIGGKDVTTATKSALDYLTTKVNGRAGVIVIDRFGGCAHGYTTRHMLWARMEAGGPITMGW